jgi:hypothetical protein
MCQLQLSARAYHRTQCVKLLRTSQILQGVLKFGPSTCKNVAISSKIDDGVKVKWIAVDTSDQNRQDRFFQVD